MHCALQQQQQCMQMCGAAPRHQWTDRCCVALDQAGTWRRRCCGLAFITVDEDGGVQFVSNAGFQRMGAREALKHSFLRPAGAA